MNARSNTTALVALLTLLMCSRASANIEPSSYDAKSIAAGTTGMAYLDNPSALAINPANLARIDRGGMSVNITPVFQVSHAPLSGPNTDVQSDLGFGPIPSLFGAVRVADRVVLGFGAYTLGLFGAKYSNVQDLYGQEGATGDFEVTFASGEAAVGVGIEVAPSFDLGVTLRVPFAWQRATIPAELGALIIPTSATLGGAGWPGGRIGLTWRATHALAVSLMYRTVATSRLSGDLSTSGLVELSSSVTARFSTPHVLSGGLAYSWLNDALTVVSRVLLRGCERKADTDARRLGAALARDSRHSVPLAKCSKPPIRGRLSNQLALRGARWLRTELVGNHARGRTARRATPRMEPFFQHRVRCRLEELRSRLGPTSCVRELIRCSEL